MLRLIIHAVPDYPQQLMYRTIVLATLCWFLRSAYINHRPHFYYQNSCTLPTLMLIVLHSRRPSQSRYRQEPYQFELVFKSCIKQSNAGQRRSTLFDARLSIYVPAQRIFDRIYTHINFSAYFMTMRLYMNMQTYDKIEIEILWFTIQYVYWEAENLKAYLLPKKSSHKSIYGRPSLNAQALTMIHLLPSLKHDNGSYPSCIC